MISSEQTEKILNLLVSFNFTVFGIAITLFTVIYSFLLNKKSELCVLNENYKRRNSESPVLKKKIDFALSYIATYKEINVLLIILIIGSFVIGISALILLFLQVSNYCVFVLIGISLLSIFYIIYLIAKITYMYHREFLKIK